MDKSSIESPAAFYNLEWDTEFFGVTCSKAILNKPLKQNEWNDLKERFNDYQFVSIENRNSEPVNAQFIGKNTSAFLADVNIQFIKKIVGVCEISNNLVVHQALKRNDQIINIADFQYSKFTEDKELAKRGGEKVYQQWLVNSFEKQDKFYVLSFDENGEINGFLLHSYSENACVIELIAVSQNTTKSGIGTSLFRAVEFAALNRGINTIKVGTQVRNAGAINFYHKVGCKQVGCHQVYHLWNL